MRTEAAEVRFAGVTALGDARSLPAYGVPAFLRAMTASLPDRQVQAITHPDKSLLTYYLLTAVIIPPLFPILVLPLYFRYHTMRYAFTDDGISMSWGILFRRQIIVNYARIQDIHLKSNIIERWLGLARILVQTASGSAGAEMTIEGIKEYEALRDFLYSRMRGVKDHHASASTATAPMAPAGSHDELAAALREAAGELRAIRAALESRAAKTER
jgi:putative membrane protein